MTIGKKIKTARKNAGLSQEQLAEKLCVSRAAVAKWETDKGLPDIMNLKTLASLLNVSVDHLLDEDAETSFRATKEPIDPSSFEVTGHCRSKYDAAVVSHYPEADYIYPLTYHHGLTKAERVINVFLLGLLIPIWQIAHWKEYTGQYYWVDANNRQIFVQIDDHFITSRLQSRSLLRSERNFSVDIDGTNYIVGTDLLR